MMRHQQTRSAVRGRVASVTVVTWTPLGDGTYSATWENGAQGTLTVWIEGERVVAVRRDLSGTSAGLRGAYVGVLSGGVVRGTVSWCCDTLAPRSGTWEARIGG